MGHGSSIDKKSAKTLIEKFQEDNPNEKKAFLFDASKIQELLEDSPSIAGVRIYMGKKTNNDLCVILVGTDSDNNDMTDDMILEYGSPCPTECPDSSYFNID